MLNIIQIWPVVSEEIFSFLYRLCKGNWPRPLAAMFCLDIIMHFRNEQQSHLQTIYATYHSNLASGFTEEDFLSFLYRHIRELAPPPGGQVFLDNIMNFRYLQESHLRTIPAKYNSILASCFTGEDF